MDIDKLIEDLSLKDLKRPVQDPVESDDDGNKIKTIYSFIVQDNLWKLKPEQEVPEDVARY